MGAILQTSERVLEHARLPSACSSFDQLETEGILLSSLHQSPSPTSKPSDFYGGGCREASCVLIQRSISQLSASSAPSSSIPLSTLTSSSTGFIHVITSTKHFPAQPQSAAAKTNTGPLTWPHSPTWSASSVVAGWLYWCFHHGNDPYTEYRFASPTIRRLAGCFICHRGTPPSVASDQGPHFSVKEMEKRVFAHRVHWSYHCPEATDLTEWWNGLLKTRHSTG